MSQLAILRSRLNTLRQRRLFVRWASAWSLWWLVVIAVVVGLFLVDVTFELPIMPRFIGITAGLAMIGWYFWRETLPQLCLRESELDMALLVERQQEIDSDLVAALQFEQTSGPQWGSTVLKQAVIEYVAEFGPTLDVFKTFDFRQVRNRLVVATMAGLGLLFACLGAPDYVATYLNRLALGNRHYPTRTRIDEFLVGGQPINLRGPTPAVRLPAGRPVNVTLRVSGEIPVTGLVTLHAVQSRTSTQLTLTSDVRPAPVTFTANQSSIALRSAVAGSAAPRFTSTLERLTEPLTLQAYLGDAWTDPVRVDVIPQPIVTLELQATPPAYAAAMEQQIPDRKASRQLSVIEGSEVDLTVHCSNKPLAQVVVTVGEQSLALRPTDASGQHWTLPADKHPFRPVQRPVTYSIQVKDLDGLELEQPLQGSIRLKQDRPPRIAAGMIARRILPAARPRILIAASDDYGLSHLKLVQEVRRATGDTYREVADIQRFPASSPAQTTYKGQYTADLQPLSLSKGDQVTLTVEAVDYRGARAGQSSASEPLVLEVTDVQGLLAGMVESDEQSARRLDAIIQRQLGIGDTK